MLRETDYIKPYPCKSIIEDLITRDGPADKNSFTPFEGKQSIIKNQFSGSQRHKFRLNDFLEHTKTRDLDPSRIKASVTSGMLVEASNQSAGYKTLEDMMPGGKEVQDVEDYIVMLCVGFKKDNTSPFRKNADYITRTVRNIDGDDDTVEEKFLQNKEEEGAISNVDYEEIIREIPYLIKSIWSYSKQYQANLFTFLFAYQDILKKRGTTKINVTDFMYYPTVLIKKDGTYVRKFDHSADNKYTIYPKVTKIFICPDDHRVEYNTCMKFLRYLEMLGIDYRDEDPLSYDNDFVNSLLVTYLPTNEEYFKDYKNIDAEIMVALKPENIFMSSKSHMYLPTLNTSSGFDYDVSSYFVSERIKLAYKLGDEDPELFEDKIDDSISILNNVLTLMSGKETFLPKDNVTFERNHFMHFQKSLVLMDGKYFGKFKGRLDYKVGITRFGFIVALEESYDDVYYLTAEDCFKAMEVYKQNGEIQTEANWKGL